VVTWHKTAGETVKRETNPSVPGVGGGKTIKHKKRRPPPPRFEKRHGVRHQQALPARYRTVTALDCAASGGARARLRSCFRQAEDHGPGEGYIFRKRSARRPGAIDSGAAGAHGNLASADAG